MKYSAEIIVSGMVQGVGYRYFTIRQAELFGLKGSVQNLPDGRVHIETEGEKEIILQFKKELEKGPRFARVDKVQIAFTEYKAKFNSFSVDY